MRGPIFLALLAATVSPAIAGTETISPSTSARPVVPTLGAKIFDASAHRVGYVLAVRTNGVVISFRSATVTLPASTISMVNGKLTTSLTRAEVAKLD